jgi:hypothetical protein
LHTRTLHHSRTLRHTRALHRTRTSPHHLTPLECATFAHELLASFLQALTRGGRQCSLHLFAMSRTQFVALTHLPFAQVAQGLTLLLRQRVGATGRRTAAPLRHRYCRHTRQQCCGEKKSSGFHSCLQIRSRLEPGARIIGRHHPGAR